MTKHFHKISTTESEVAGDSSASGFIEDTFEGFSQSFTDMEVIHTSGMNVVAKAKRYGRWWLLKGLRQEVTHEEAYRQRLRKEVEVMMSMQHPNIVTVVGLEKVAGLGDCIVMEYVEGKTLEQTLQEGLPPAFRKRQMAGELMDAVEYMHTNGIVHRDLKPANIMVTTYGGHVKVVDFGLADTYSHAVLKQPAGTPRYMAPEQKEKAVADIRNDIYSLGVILEQMQIDSAYRRAATRCLLPADQRYQSVAQLKHDLNGIASARKKALRGTLAIALLALAGAVAYTAYLLHGQRQTIDAQQQQIAMQKDRMARQQEQMASLRQDVADGKVQQDAQRLVIHSLTDSVANLSEDNTALMQKQEMERQRTEMVEEAKRRGRNAIDEAYRQARFEQTMKEDMDWEQALDAFNQCCASTTAARNQYLLSIRPQFSDDEYGGIERALADYDSERYLTKWKKKMENPNHNATE